MSSAGSMQKGMRGDEVLCLPGLCIGCQAASNKCTGHSLSSTLHQEQDAVSQVLEPKATTFSTLCITAHIRHVSVTADLCPRSMPLLAVLRRKPRC